MKLQEVLKIINTKPKGSFITLLYTRPIKLKKSASAYNYGTKTTRCTIRTGISYVNTKAYKIKKAEEYNKLLQTNPTLEQMNNFFDNRMCSSLPWGKWHIPNIILKHTKDDITKYYLRCFSSINKSSVTYMLNGQPISKEQLKKLDICLSSEFTQNNEGCFTLDIDYIDKIY